MIELDVKLPKTYYAFADLVAEEQPKDDRQRIAVSLSAYQACKLDEYCYNNDRITLQHLFKKIVIDEIGLTDEEVGLKNTERKKFDFLKDDKFECEHFAKTGASKQYLVYLSSYAKTKIIQYLIKNKIDFTWFLKKNLVKKEILTIEDLSK